MRKIIVSQRTYEMFQEIQSFVDNAMAIRTDSGHPVTVMRGEKILDFFRGVGSGQDVGGAGTYMVVIPLTNETQERVRAFINHLRAAVDERIARKDVAGLSVSLLIVSHGVRSADFESFEVLSPSEAVDVMNQFLAGGERAGSLTTSPQRVASKERKMRFGLGRPPVREEDQRTGTSEDAAQSVTSPDLPQDSGPDRQPARRINLRLGFPVGRSESTREAKGAEGDKDQRPRKGGLVIGWRRGAEGEKKPGGSGVPPSIRPEEQETASLPHPEVADDKHPITAFPSPAHPRLEGAKTVDIGWPIIETVRKIIIAVFFFPSWQAGELEKAVLNRIRKAGYIVDSRVRQKIVLGENESLSGLTTDIGVVLVDRPVTAIGYYAANMGGAVVVIPSVELLFTVMTDISSRFVENDKPVVFIIPPDRPDLVSGLLGELVIAEAIPHDVFRNPGRLAEAVSGAVLRAVRMVVDIQNRLVEI